jgi:hypothetical protein
MICSLNVLLAFVFLVLQYLKEIEIYNALVLELSQDILSKINKTA